MSSTIIVICCYRMHARAIIVVWAHVWQPWGYWRVYAGDHKGLRACDHEGAYAGNHGVMGTCLVDYEGMCLGNHEGAYAGNQGVLGTCLGAEPPVR